MQVLPSQSSSGSDIGCRAHFHGSLLARSHVWNQQKVTTNRCSVSDVSAAVCWASKWVFPSFGVCNLSPSSNDPVACSAEGRWSQRMNRRVWTLTLIFTLHVNLVTYSRMSNICLETRRCCGRGPWVSVRFVFRLLWIFVTNLSACLLWNCFMWPNWNM